MAKRGGRGDEGRREKEEALRDEGEGGGSGGEGRVRAGGEGSERTDGEGRDAEHLVQPLPAGPQPGPRLGPQESREHLGVQRVLTGGWNISNA